MKRLFQLELARLSKQRSTWVIAIIILFLGGFNVVLAWATSFENLDGTRAFFYTTRQILEMSFQLGQIQILLIGILSSLFIASDMNQGTIRNKIIAGYSKSEIYWVHLGMAMIITFSGLVLFHTLPSAFVWLITFPITSDQGGSLTNFIIHMSFGYGLVMLGVLITSWIALSAKSVATAIIFTLLIFVLGPTLTIVVKSIIQAVTIANLNIDAFNDPEGFQQALQTIDRYFEWVYFYQLQRLANIDSLFNNSGPLNFFNEAGQRYIWKTLASSAILMTLIVGFGSRRFARSDLK
jgi:hypothetical protein